MYPAFHLARFFLSIGSHEKECLQPAGTIYRRRFPTFKRKTFDQLAHTLFALDARDALLQALELGEFRRHDVACKVECREFGLGQRFLDGGVEFGGVGGREGDKGGRGRAVARKLAREAEQEDRKRTSF